MAEDGRVLARARLPEGVEGMVRLHAMVAAQAGDAGDDELRVLAEIETDRGPWVAALVAAGYQVFAVNSLQAARYREPVSGSRNPCSTRYRSCIGMAGVEAHDHGLGADGQRPGEYVVALGGGLEVHEHLTGLVVRTVQLFGVPDARDSAPSTAVVRLRVHRVPDLRGDRVEQVDVVHQRDLLEPLARVVVPV